MSDENCYTRAKANGERTFTLRAQDRSSPWVICDWIRENIMTCPPDKLREALDVAIEMRSWRNRKFAD